MVALIRVFGDWIWGELKDGEVKIVNLWCMCG